MKFVSYLQQGQSRYGAVLQANSQDLVVGLNAAFGQRAADLRSLIAAGLLREAGKWAAAHGPEGVALSAVELLPPIPNPDKIVCVGLNYMDHVKETGRDLTEKPALFLRVPSSQVAHGQPIVRPHESVRLDYECEIAVIIGKPGRRISEADSWSHIAGYSCYNDGSVRDWQNFTTQWTAGKNYWRTGGFGPWIVDADEIKPGQKLTLCTRLNGVEMQRSDTTLMIHSIPRLIHFISTVMPLEPGDVIVTGTPGGVGNKRNPQVFMKPGDVVEVEIDAVGMLRNTIVDG
jgi:2-keto-4-pentenoate hydratase/2-oxohepta-3-ene-1,7-dioic acid hydratase in catechol pathway